MADEETPEDGQVIAASIPAIKSTFDFSTLLKGPASISQAMARLQHTPAINVKFANIAKQMDLSSVFQQATIATKKITSLAASLSQAQVGIGSTLAKTMESYQQALRSTIKDIDFDVVEEYLLEPFNTLASEYGWPPSDHFPTSVPNAIATEALKIEDPDKRFFYVNEQILGLFQGEDLDKVYEDWEKQSYLKDTERLGIIKAAFEAHKEGNYSLSSPAILPQIEGLFIERVEGIKEHGEHERPINDKDYEKHIDRLRETKNIVLAIRMGEILYHFVQEHGLFGSKNSKYNPIAYDISRHKILHGRSTAYCKREDISLRHLLWLDCVITLINQLNPKDEEDL